MQLSDLRDDLWVDPNKGTESPTGFNHWLSSCGMLIPDRLIFMFFNGIDENVRGFKFRDKENGYPLALITPI